MPPPPPGAYYIINRAQAPSSFLALTYNGEGQPVTVTARSNLPIQTWFIGPLVDGLQTVSPIVESELQVGPADGSANLITTFPSLPQTAWNIQTVDQTFSYSFFQGTSPYVWSLNGPAIGAPVSLAWNNGSNTQKWELVPV